MKLTIEILGLHYLADTVAAAIHHSASEICATLKTMKSEKNNDGIKHFQGNYKSKDGLFGSNWIMYHYGLSQKQTTEARKALRLHNHGTVSHPRYTMAAIHAMVLYWKNKK